MQYVKVHKSIPVFHIIYQSVEVDSGDVGTPYIIMRSGLEYHLGWHGGLKT